MKKLLLLIMILFSFQCFRLDSFAFNPLTDITSYKMEGYTGEVQFKLPASYNISPSMATLLTLNSSDDSGATRKIKAIYIGDIAQIPVQKVILYCHGNYGHMDYYWQRAKLLANLGPTQHTYGVMYFDYQGYGLSEGSPSEGNLSRDADAALQWLKSKGLTSNRLIMYGYSLGSVPATNLTANVRSMQPSLLVLESPIGSAAILIQDGSGLNLPSSYFTSLTFDNAQEIKKVTEPFYWMHGAADDFVNINNGEAIFANYGGTISKAVRVSGANHGNLPEVMGYASYLNSLYSFISTYLP